MVDQARRRYRGPDPLVDGDHHLEDALALHERLYAVADLDLRRGLRCATIYADVSAPACGRRRRPGLIEPDRPQPDIYPSRVDLAIVPA